MNRLILILALALFVCSALAAEKPGPVLVVSPEEPGAFKTIQQAVAAVQDNLAAPTVIRIRPGIYQGPVVVPTGKKLVTFAGEDAATTIITWERNVKDAIPEGADGTNPGVHIRGNGFHAENITFQNTSGDHGQALALRVDADRAVFKNCRLLGWQDTVMLNGGRQYFKDCTIEGRVDFIYGDGTAVFDGCHIHSKNGGYITAASTPPERPFGFVFLRCKLTGDAVPWVDPTGAVPAKVQKLPNTHLGRPWRPQASVTFIECEMGGHILPAGWNNWGKVENEQTARYAEYGSTGPGANPDARLPWSKQLTDAEAKKYTVENVLKGGDGWNPSAKR